MDTKLYEAVSWINKILQHCQFTPPSLTVFRRWRGGGGGGGNWRESQRMTAGLHRWRRRWRGGEAEDKAAWGRWPLTVLSECSCRALTSDPCLLLQRKRRRRACGCCVACLREDCGKCLYCLDKRKFGGPEKKKQRCQLRVCLVVVSICGCLYRRLLVRTGAAALLLSPPQESTFRPRPPQTNLTVTTATELQHHRWRRGRDENEEVRDPCWSQLCLIYFCSTVLMCSRRINLFYSARFFLFWNYSFLIQVKVTRMRGRRWGGGRATLRWMKKETGGGEKKKKNSPSAQVSK